MVDTMTLTPAELDATLTRVFAGNRGGGEAEERPALPEPEDVPPEALALEDDRAEPLGRLPIPAHLLRVVPDYRGLEDALSRLATATEAHRAFDAQRAWLCARAYVDAADADSRRDALGQMAGLMGIKGRQVYRYVKLGLVFAPEDMIPEMSQAVHLVAARANYPLAALRYAHDQGYNAAQLTYFLTTNRQPPTKTHPVDERYDDPRLIEDALALLGKAWQDAMLAADGRRMEFRVRLDVTYDEPEAA